MSDVKSLKPPFRADHVGSLLRSDAVHRARDRRAKGEITPEDLRAIEDVAIRDAVALQEAAGLQGITDGEIRRGFWHVDFLSGIDGVAPTQSNYAVAFKGEGGATAETRSMLVVKEKVRRSRPIALADFAFLKSVTTRTAKLCIPAPTYLHMRGGRQVVDKTAYPEMSEFWDDIIRAYREELADLAAAGCTYLQFDDVSFAGLCDKNIRIQVARDGEDPAKLPLRYANIINAIIAGRPKNMTVTLHTCRGNFQSMWMGSGGYDAVAEGLFANAAVDGFFLEYDDARSGDFAPLRFVPKGKRVVLGLISSKRAELESKDELKRRIEQAAKFVPLENLCLSPQCGFASSHHGNRVTEDVEQRKFALAVEVATEIWGGL
jgi:5-methyltetrahydropteroyltriglutamate--homocysteine methyltransferase